MSPLLVRACASRRRPSRRRRCSRAGLRPARLRLRLRDGRLLEAQALTNKGDTEDPYSQDEVRLKFHELAEPVFGKAQSQRIAQAVDGIERAADIAELGRLLAPAALEK